MRRLSLALLAALAALGMRFLLSQEVRAARLAGFDEGLRTGSAAASARAQAGEELRRHEQSVQSRESCEREKEELAERLPACRSVPLPRRGAQNWLDRGPFDRSL